MKKILIAIVGLLFYSVPVFSQEAYVKIRNSELFYKAEKKFRVRYRDELGQFQIVDANSNKTVFTGEMIREKKSERSSKIVVKVDFTDFQKEGKFKVVIPGVKVSDVFTITSLNHAIRINQIGYYNDGPKAAIISGSDANEFFIVDMVSGDTVFGSPLQKEMVWKNGKELVRKADFSRLKKSGEYKIVVPDFGSSHNFKIGKDIHRSLSQGALKAYYFNRASLELEEKYAGQWKRPIGHKDDSVVVHPSAASPGRPAGTIINSSMGWYDAGDYGKYIVNSGISVYTLLSAYDNYPEYFNKLEVNIPRKYRKVPAILEEALFELASTIWN